MKISFIGIGRLGGALTLALSEKGFKIENLFTRHPNNAAGIARETNAKIKDFDEIETISSDVVFITTRDFEIQTTAENLAGHLKSDTFVFHTSGALSSEELKSLKKSGCFVGSLHPLVSVSDATLGKSNFKGAYFCVEGDAEAVKLAEQIVEKIGGNAFTVAAEFKTLYHASAVTACGHLIALADTAIEMLSQCGIEKPAAQKILLPLIESTVGNLETQTPAQALTGPFARADVQTFRRHLESLENNVSKEVLETYLQLAARSAHLAQEQSANIENSEQMRREILLAKNNIKC